MLKWDFWGKSRKINGIANTPATPVSNSRLFLPFFLFLDFFFRSGHHLRVGIVVHETRVSSPCNHGLKDILSVLVRQRGGDILHHRFSVDFLLDFQVAENDMEQSELFHLFSEDLLPRI